jgi:acetyltransferase-like isoleucine patch superfamily enzyme
LARQPLALTTTGRVQDLMRFLRLYAYGLIHYLLDVACSLPSQHLRRWLLTSVFKLKIGRQTIIYRGCRLRAPWKIRVGAGSVIGLDVELDGRGSLEIGENVNISSQVMIWTMQHDHRDPEFKAVAGKVKIERYVWLGPRVIVLPGITVAEGCVVGAAAVVTEDTEPYGIYAGIPARRIGERIRELRYVPGSRYMPFV